MYNCLDFMMLVNTTFMYYIKEINNVCVCVCIFLSSIIKSKLIRNSESEKPRKLTYAAPTVSTFVGL